MFKEETVTVSDSQTPAYDMEPKLLWRANKKTSPGKTGLVDVR